MVRPDNYSLPEIYNRYGFTLIELSIVIVIIGLLMGGVLMGKDLIKAAEIRSQISQIEEIKTAVNTFRVKYGYLPGDMPPAQASQLGFFAFTGTYAGGTSGSQAYGNNDGYIYIKFVRGISSYAASFPSQIIKRGIWWNRCN